MLHRYLNAHLELFEHGFDLWDLTQNLPQWKGQPDPPEPFLLSDDDSQPSEWRLAPLDFIYLDAPALAAFGTAFLAELPNLRQLYIYAPERELDLEFLKNLPELTYLQLQCRSVKDQAPLLSLQQLEEVVLEFRKPDLKALQSLPKLKRAYFNPADAHEVKAFLEQCPDCEVDYAFDADYAPRFRTAKVGELYLRYFDYVDGKDKDTLELYIEELMNDSRKEAPSEAELQEFRKARILLVEQLLEEYRTEENLITWTREHDHDDVYMCSLQFQRLLTGHGEELLEALEDFRRLNAEGFLLPKMEWWLLKHEDLQRQLLRALDGRSFPPSEDENFEFRHCAEISFLEAFRKLDHCAALWRRKEHWEATLEELQTGRLQLQEFIRREIRPKKGVWVQVRELNLVEGQGQLKLKFEGYREVVDLPREDFEAAYSLVRRVERFVLWGDEDLGGG